MKKDVSHLAAQGHAKAFGALCQANRDSLLQTAQAVVYDVGAAEDLLQEALLECYVNLSDLKDPDKILAWMRGVIRNRCYNYLRGRRTIPFPVARFEREPTPMRSPMDQLESVENRAQVRQAIERLSEKNRRATELYYLEEKSVKEVSQLLGISEGATRVRLNRSRVLLKELLIQVYHPAILKEEQGMAEQVKQEGQGLSCSFCGQSVEDLEVLITGPGVNICSLCVQACMQVIIKKHDYTFQLMPKVDDSISGAHYWGIVSENILASFDLNKK